MLLCIKSMFRKLSPLSSQYKNKNAFNKQPKLTDTTDNVEVPESVTSSIATKFEGPAQMSKKSMLHFEKK